MIAALAVLVAGLVVAVAGSEIADRLNGGPISNGTYAAIAVSSLIGYRLVGEAVWWMLQLQ